MAGMFFLQADGKIFWSGKKEKLGGFLIFFSRWSTCFQV
jgi:hypothetical protein